MNKTYIIIGIAVVVLGFVLFGGSKPILGTSGQPISQGVRVSNTSSTVALSASVVLAAQPERQFLSISNIGGFDVYLGFGTSTGLVAGTGHLIKASTTQIFTGDTLYVGTIYGIGVGTTTLSIEKL